MNKYIEFDVMDGDRYVCTMRYLHCQPFKVNKYDLLDFVYKQRPTLRKRKNLHIELCEEHECNYKTFVGRKKNDRNLRKRKY